MPSQQQLGLEPRPPGQASNPLLDQWGAGQAIELEKLQKQLERLRALAMPGFQPRGGSGASFIDGLGYRGRSFADPAGFIDPTSGGRNQFNTPFLLAAFLRSQMGADGFLSPVQRSLGVAGDVRDLIGQGNQLQRNLLDSLSSSGIDDSIANMIAERTRYDTNRGLSALLSEAEAGHRERMFGAQQEFVNAVSQTAIAEKQQRSQEKIAREGADATRSAGKSNMIGNILGGALGAIL